MKEVSVSGNEVVVAEVKRGAWQAPALKRLPRLTELTLQTGGGIPGGGGGGGTVF